MTRRIIVTGGTGFIGTLICNALAAQGIEVHAWARGRTPSKKQGGASNIQLHRVDIYDEAAVISALKSTQASEMIHLAWGGLPNYMSSHHMDFELVNQLRFVRTVLDHGISVLTQTGTCFEYGVQNGALHENQIVQPTNPYGFAKLSLLRYVEFLSQEQRRDFSYKWLRLFYMYGPGQGPKSLYSLLCAAQARGDTSFEMSTGHQIRDFSPISDIISRIIALHDPKIPCGVYNVCSGKPISVRQLVEQWCDELDYKVKLDLGVIPIPTYEAMAFWGDSSKMLRALASVDHA